VPARNYGHDLDAMLAAITPNTRVVIVANPNNPTGSSARREDLARFVNAVPANVLVALDEAYMEFLDEPVYLLPQMRLGYGIAHADLIAEFEKVRQPFNINAIAQAGALAALDDTAHAEKTRKGNSRGLRFYARAFRKLGLEFVPSSANFVLVRVGDGQGVFNAMQKLGVIVRPMGGYQLPEWVRISIGTSKENTRCLEALKSPLAKAEPVGV